MSATQLGISAGLAHVAGYVWDRLAVFLYRGPQYQPLARFLCSMCLPGLQCLKLLLHSCVWCLSEDGYNSEGMAGSLLSI